MLKKFLCVFMVTTMSLLTLSGCSGGLSGKKSEESPYDEFIVVDVFDSLANYQGIQSGWFAKIVKDKFNMELNIIAPNVASGGDTLFEIRTASGNLGDLIICSTEDGVMQDLVDEGLVIDMADLLEGKDIMNYGTSISILNDKLNQEGIYAIPSEISSLPATTSCEGLELNYGPYLRWDIYSSIGYPQMSSLEDLLPVLKEMQEIMPETPSGNPTYAFSFFKDWDDNMMTAAKQPACFYGYDEIGFVLAKADGSDYQNILDTDSIYMRILKLYNDAYQMGLVDPDSTIQSYEDMFKKYQAGAILYSPWPWLGQSAFNTTENKEDGKGFMLASIDDMQIFSYGCNTEGNQKTVISIGSQAEDPGRLADFIDWLYSPEGIQIGCAQPSSGTAGPKGLAWEMDENGPYLTDFGKKALLGNNTEVPAEWGGGIWEDGVSQLNFRPVSQSDKDPDGHPYYYTLWSSVLGMDASTLDIDWRNFMNAESTHEYLEKNNQIIVAPGCGYVAPDIPSEIVTMRGQCRSVIIDYSWQMVFAPDEDTFYRLMDQMQREAKALGYEVVYEEDLKNAKEQDTARKAAAALSGN
jgi:multiple sugar transport system substrate-binding protein/putative aldouronate transport system substrate-binding protein